MGAKSVSRKPKPVTFGQRLRSLRLEAGLTQEALAARLDAHRMTVAKLESGQSLPSVELLAWIAMALGSDSLDIFDGVMFE